jgi:SMC interacting uncharacterized protein involved in chromosome segregation
MTINEILKAKGISDETVADILETMKTNKIFLTDEENIDLRFNKLKTENDTATQQLTEANALIEELKKGTKGQEGLQQKITAYETQVQQLQSELEKTKLEAAIKVELLSSKAKDVDYLAYKLNEKLKHDGETLTLDDNGAIKGWDDKLAGLKTQFPTMFETESGNGDGYQIYQPNKLKSGDGGEPTPTKESFKTMSYEQRVALKQKNETLYKQLSK